jgi:hypothetical protein
MAAAGFPAFQKGNAASGFALLAMTREVFALQGHECVRITLVIARSAATKQSIFVQCRIPPSNAVPCSTLNQ